MRKCKGCGKRYKRTPDQPPFQSWCSIDCGIVVARERQAKARRKETRQRKESLKTRQEWLKETQYEFNRFIRARDHDQPCISCGKHHNGQYHAGHYLTTKARPELRFNEIGCHKQCQPCNTHLSGDITNYRRRLIEKIGLPLVEWLEGPHPTPVKWTIDELKALKKYYRQRANEAIKHSEHVL